MSQRPRIAVDASGGDGGLDVTVPAVLSLIDRAHWLLVGPRDHILTAYPDARACELIDAAEVIGPEDDLATVLRGKPDSSMRIALSLCAEGRVDGVVSGGDTAALMALSRHILDMVPGIRRPAIGKRMLGQRKPFWFIDLGANIDCSADQLLQFARMGVIAARALDGVTRPKVALLNIGTEMRKGPSVLKAVAEALAAIDDLEFIGYVEGTSMFAGAADVIVTDGFAGNIALKAIEGTASMARHLITTSLAELRPLERLGIWLARPALQRLATRLNPERYNGASFFGLRQVVVKSHGSANRLGFEQALLRSLDEVKLNLPAILQQQLASAAGAGSVTEAPVT